jgi:hypothetical protein
MYLPYLLVFALVTGRATANQRDGLAWLDKAMAWLAWLFGLSQGQGNTRCRKGEGGNICSFCGPFVTYTCSEYTHESSKGNVEGSENGPGFSH